MAWKKSGGLIGGQLNRMGLGPAVLAGTVCQHAETLYPNLFKATSLVDGVLRISLPIENQMQFRNIEGKLLADLKEFAVPRNLPIPTRVRLTITRESASI
jgi:hypothetical protein